jgi:hypothetical protein
MYFGMDKNLHLMAELELKQSNMMLWAGMTAR